MLVLLLALDTSSRTGSLAVLRDEKAIGLVSSSSDEAYSSRMFRHLDFLLGELSLELQKFELFTVVMGPGSFTGLRVGLAAVKGWAEVYGKPVAGVSALHSIATQAVSHAQRVVPIIDARRGEFYFASYIREAPGLALEGEERVGPPEELADFLQSICAGRKCVIATPDCKLVSDALSKYSAEFPSIELASDILAPFAGRIGREKALGGQAMDALSLDANYVRRSDSEVKLKGPKKN